MKILLRMHIESIPFRFAGRGAAAPCRKAQPKTADGINDRCNTYTTRIDEIEKPLIFSMDSPFVTESVPTLRLVLCGAFQSAAHCTLMVGALHQNTLACLTHRQQGIPDSYQPLTWLFFPGPEAH